MVLIVTIVIFRCKRPKVTEPANSNTNPTAPAPGEPIPYGGFTQVMYTNTPTAVPRVVMPNGSPSFVYTQNTGQMEPQVPISHQLGDSAPEISEGSPSRVFVTPNTPPPPYSETPTTTVMN